MCGCVDTGKKFVKFTESLLHIFWQQKFLNDVTSLVKLIDSTNFTNKQASSYLNIVDKVVNFICNA